MSGVFVRARTADARWASVDAAELDERSFREFVLWKMAGAGMVACLVGKPPEFNTSLTKQQAEHGDD